MCVFDLHGKYVRQVNTLEAYHRKLIRKSLQIYPKKKKKKIPKITLLLLGCLGCFGSSFKLCLVRFNFQTTASTLISLHRIMFRKSISMSKRHV